MPCFRHAIAIGKLHAIRDDDAAQPDPLAMVAAACERKASADAIAAGYANRLPGWGGGRRGAELEVRIHGTTNLLIEESGDVSTVAVDHGTPADRPIRHGQRLEHAKLRKRVEFRTSPDTRHGHSEDTSLLQRCNNRRR